MKKLDSRASQSEVGYKRRVRITCSPSILPPPNSPPKWALCKTPIDHRLSPSMSLSSRSSSSVLQLSSRSSISSSQMESPLSRMSRSASTHRTTHPSPISHSRHSPRLPFCTSRSSAPLRRITTGARRRILADSSTDSSNSSSDLFSE